MKIESIIGDYNIFLSKIFLNLKKSEFSFNEFKELDHIAYRVENNNRYKEIKKELDNNFTETLSEKLRAGRLISVFKLKEPLEFENFKINCLELLAPKEDNAFKEGLEHAEFVINISLNDFCNKYKNFVDFNLSAYDREINPELIVKFDGCAVKFHNQSLLKIRGLE